MHLLALEPLLIVGILGAVAAFAGLAWWLSPYQRTLRALRSAPRVRIADAPDGSLVRIVGTLRARDATLVAPLSARPCSHYDVNVEVRRSSGKNHRWVQLFRETQSRDFQLEDESGVAIVQTASFECAVVNDHHQSSGFLNDATPELEALLSRHGHASTSFLGLNRAMRYREGVLEAGETIAVLGRARWEDDPELGAISPEQGGYRESGRRKRLVIEAESGPVRASDDPAALS